MQALAPPSPTVIRWLDERIGRGELRRKILYLDSNTREILRTLDVSGNWIVSLPPQIGLLRNLVHLNVARNRLHALSAEIGDLKTLQYLRLAHNELYNLPAEIAKLPFLVELDLDYNQFTEMPDVTWRLTTLRLLFIQNNQLSQLAPDVADLRLLTTLRMDGNQFTSLPAELGSLPELNYLGMMTHTLPRGQTCWNREEIIGYLRELDGSGCLTRTPWGIWTPRNHAQFPRRVRAEIGVLLLMRARCNWQFPKDLLLLIIRWVATRLN